MAASITADDRNYKPLRTLLFEKWGPFGSRAIVTFDYMIHYLVRMNQLPIGIVWSR